MSSESGAACPVPIRQRDEIILGHGSGGRMTARLIEEMILPAFGNPWLEPLEDQAVMALHEGGRLAFTTDSYVVTPIFFPGGDIGSLAVHGTVNDLAVGGAVPLALSVGLILEEGLPLDDLRRVLESMARAAAVVGVPVVTGDTKVVGRGSGDGIFVNTSGIGLVRSGLELGAARIEPGDAVLVSGTLGDHGVAILAQREGLLLEGEIRSDSAPLHDLVGGLLDACPAGIHAMRDATRGGLATVLVEMARRRGVGIELCEEAVPVADGVRGACELLGLDPMLVANEGKLVAFVAPQHAEAALDALRAHPLGRDAARVGRVVADPSATVVVETSVGGRRVLDLPFGEQLPRIC